jgi:hypothetical protein
MTLQSATRNAFLDTNEKSHQKKAAPQHKCKQLEFGGKQRGPYRFDPNQATYNRQQMSAQTPPGPHAFVSELRF